MSCERHERDLALLVEGDLPAGESARLEQHLASCPRCEGFLSDLQASQRGLKSLAAEPLDATALASVRARVLAAVVREPASKARRAWLWWPSLAATAAVLALLVIMVAWPRTPVAPTKTAVTVPMPQPPRAAAAISGPPGATVTVGPGPREAPPVERGSAVRSVPAVQRREKALRAPELSPEEADQLARAVISVSRIRRVSDAPGPEAAETEPPGEEHLERPPLMAVLTSDDSDVVIYWQFDSNGG